MEDKYIYIVFSATPYAIGKAIRRITGDPYNHVSISLDRDMTQMYSFARRYYRLPLYGGFVKESLFRYRLKGQNTQICLCKLPVKAGQFDTLQTLLSGMYQNRERYLYNHLSVLTSPFRRPVKLQDAYTCVEFIATVLSQLALLPEAECYRSVGDLERLLRPYRVYAGPIPDTDDYDNTFFSPRPVPHPFLTTAGAFFALFGRIK